jgi:hypothetical protein
MKNAVTLVRQRDGKVWEIVTCKVGVSQILVPLSSFPYQTLMPSG